MHALDEKNMKKLHVKNHYGISVLLTKKMNKSQQLSAAVNVKSKIYITTKKRVNS